MEMEQNLKNYHPNSPPISEEQAKRNRERNFRSRSEQFEELRSHMKEYGPPKTGFYSGDSLPQIEVPAQVVNDRQIANEEHGVALEDLRDILSAPQPGETILAQELDPQAHLRGLTEVEYDHYEWLKKMIPVVGGSIDDIMDEVHAIDAKWQNDGREVGIKHPKFMELLEDDGQKFELLVSAHELSKELKLFKRDYEKLLKKIKTHTHKNTLTEKQAKNQEVIRKIDEIQEEEMARWFAKDVSPEESTKGEELKSEDVNAEEEIKKLRQKYSDARNMRGTPEKIEQNQEENIEETA